MPNNDAERPDPEDMFHESRMSFGDHIEDLRSHLLRALLGFSVGMVLSLFFFGQFVMRIIVEPVETQLERFALRNLKRDQAEAKEKIERTGLMIPPITIHLKIKKQTSSGETPPVLDKMVHGIERMLLSLDAHDLLGPEDLAQGHYEIIEAQITDPFVFNKEIQEISTKVNRKRLTTMHITEAFMVYFKIAVMTGLVISSPWVFYHIWMFIAAGLYPQEKKLVNIYLPFSLFLFLSGVLLCQFAVIPKAIEAMLWFNEWLGIGADLRLNEWLGFALMMPIVFGISFQTPLVMMFLHKVGILTVETYRDYRRISWMVMAIFAAVITPSVDAFSMLFLWVPMGFLYELGIVLCVWQGKNESLAEWEIEEKQNELVEV
jgi:sec-independent protein translocase protein TatC